MLSVTVFGNRGVATEVAKPGKAMQPIPVRPVKNQEAGELHKCVIWKEVKVPAYCRLARGNSAVKHNEKDNKIKSTSTRLNSRS